MGNTSIHSLPWPAGTGLVKDGDDRIKDLADAIDTKLSPVTAGLLSARPTSSPGSPGKLGRKYYATDNGVTYLDYGTGWTPLNGERIYNYYDAVAQAAGASWANAPAGTGSRVLTVDGPSVIFWALRIWHGSLNAGHTAELQVLIDSWQVGYTSDAGSGFSVRKELGGCNFHAGGTATFQVQQKSESASYTSQLTALKLAAVAMPVTL